MVIAENCHHYDNDDVVINSTAEENRGLVVCSWQQPLLTMGETGTNGTDHCAVAAVCVAERTGFAFAIPAICCVGILLNILNLVVLSTNKFPESSYSYLAALAVADVLSLFFFGVNGIGRGNYHNDPGWRAFEVYAYFPLGSSSTTASIFLTVTVTVERYAFIYHPLRSKAWCHQGVARRVVAVVVAISVALNLPRFFAMYVGDEGQLEFTEFGRSSYYSWIVWIYFSVVSVGSCVCLIVFNTLLIVGIHRTHRKRRTLITLAKTETRNQDEATLTRTLIMVVCVFVAGEFPSSFTSRSVVVALIGRGDLDLLRTPSYRLAVLVATGLVVIQHSLNFVVYCVFNRRFCTVLRHRFLPTICRREPELILPPLPSPKAGTPEANSCNRIPALADAQV